jgi:hypothetical protein
MVYLNFLLACTNVISGATGDLMIDGLPYQSGGGENYANGVIIINTINLGLGYIPNIIANLSSSNSLNIIATGPSGSDAKIRPNQVKDNFEVRGSFVYKAL